MNLKVHHFFNHVQRSWLQLSTNWIIQLVNKFVFVLSITSLALLLWRWWLLPPQVPLFYSRPWGQDQLAHPGWLFLLPLGSVLWYGISTLLATYVTGEYLIFTQTLFLTTLVTSLLSFITLFKILFLVS